MNSILPMLLLDYFLTWNVQNVKEIQYYIGLSGIL